ncbi:MAG: hypothetical protein GVY26_16095 [Bacteroidetes bacterium]|jgi:hypothetical protein|nr:hypothetical protein [Bacteroidota bacterium]
MRPFPSLRYFLLFWALTQLFYYPTWDAGFVADFTGLMVRFEGRTAAGILDCFGFPALQQVLNAVLYGMYSLFELRPLPWYFVFTSLHALNAWLLFRLARRLLQGWNAKNAFWISLAAALFFLLCPYQSEPVTYRVCINFLLSGTSTLGVLLLARQWLAYGRPAQLWGLQALFLGGLFTFELQLALPFLSSLLVAVVPRLASSRLNAWLLLSLPQFLGIALYFLLNRLLLGAWVGHYGAEVHLRFQPLEILGNVQRYALKLTAWVRHYPHPWKEALFGYFNTPGLVIGITALAVLLLLWGSWRFRSLAGHWKMAWFAALGYGLTIAPVSNLYFNFLLHISNDRYSYLASAFFFLLLASLLGALPKKWLIAAALAYLLGSSYYLHQNNQRWAASNDIYQGLLEDFRWHEAPALFFLNLPDNYQGAWLFGDYRGNNLGFYHALKHIKGEEIQQPEGIREVAYYNMRKPEDAASAQVDSSGQVRVEFDQWGNWWMYRGIGLGEGYETERYRVVNEGHHYFLNPLEVPAGSVFLLQKGDRWEEVLY